MFISTYTVKLGKTWRKLNKHGISLRRTQVFARRGQSEDAPPIVRELTEDIVGLVCLSKTPMRFFPAHDRTDRGG